MAPTKSTVPAEVGPSSHSHSLSPQLPPSSSFVYSQNQRPPYLASLSDTQFAAATYGASKSLQILAGPGSGKTRVLTSRVAWLILDPGNSLQPEDVVVVTFTNKAASEMKKRLDVLVGPERTARLIIGTFHATCARYLRKYGQLIDLRNNFSIMDADDSKKAVKDIVKDLTPTLEAQGIVLKAEQALSEISKAKAKDLSPAEYWNTIMKQPSQPSQTSGSWPSSDSTIEFKSAIATTYERYQKHLNESNALDFDDLLVYGVKLFREVPQTVSNVKHVLVDEFQDTNTAQYLLMYLIAKSSKSVSIVGDPDQSIYGWRSAEIGNLQRMQKDFKGTHQVQLEENYRSTGSILEVALKIVKQDTSRVDKGLFTSHPSGPPVTRKEAPSAQAEASFIASEIRRIVAYTGGMLNYNDFVVLLRFNALSRSLEGEFQRQGIPSRMMGGRKFFDRMEVKDILSYLSLVDNPGFTPAFLRVINVPKRGIGDKGLADFVAKASDVNMKPMELAESIVSENKAFGGIRPNIKRGLTGLVRAVQDLRKAALDRAPVSELIEMLIEKIDYKAHLKKEPDFDSRWENVQELISFSKVVEQDRSAIPELPEIRGEAEIRIESEAGSSKDGKLISPQGGAEETGDSWHSAPAAKESQESDMEMQGGSNTLEDEDEEADHESKSIPSSAAGNPVIRSDPSEVIDLCSSESDGGMSEDPRPSKRIKTVPSSAKRGSAPKSKKLESTFFRRPSESKKESKSSTKSGPSEKSNFSNPTPLEALDKTPLRIFLEASILSTDMEEEQAEEVEGEDEGERKKNSQKVTISTCHAAKGLEWPVVFVLAVEDGTFPFYRCTTPKEIDEERRLLYVAITRAEALLYLTSSSFRYIGVENQKRMMSRFLRGLVDEGSDRGGLKGNRGPQIKLCQDQRPNIGSKEREEISRVLKRELPDEQVITKMIQEFEQSAKGREIALMDSMNEAAAADYSEDESDEGDWRRDSSNNFRPYTSAIQVSPTKRNPYSKKSDPSNNSRSLNSTFSDERERKMLGFSRPSIGGFSSALDQFESGKGRKASVFGSDGVDTKFGPSGSKQGPGFLTVRKAFANPSSSGFSSWAGKNGNSLAQERIKNKSLTPHPHPTSSSKCSIPSSSDLAKKEGTTSFIDEMRLKSKEQDPVMIIDPDKPGFLPKQRPRADLESFQKANELGLKSFAMLLNDDVDKEGSQNASRDEGEEEDGTPAVIEVDQNLKSNPKSFGKRRLGMGIARPNRSHSGGGFSSGAGSKAAGLNKGSRRKS